MSHSFQMGRLYAWASTLMVALCAPSLVAQQVCLTAPERARSSIERFLQSTDEAAWRSAHGITAAHVVDLQPLTDTDAPICRKMDSVFIAPPAYYFRAGAYIVASNPTDLTPDPVTGAIRHSEAPTVFVFDSIGSPAYVPGSEVYAGPTDLRAAVAVAGNVELRWANQPTSATSLRLQRAIGTGSFVNLGGMVAKTDSSTRDSTASSATTYRYRVAAMWADGNAYYYSNVITVVPSDSAIVARVSSGLLFRDDFNRADGDPGPNWVAESGTWAIVGNKLQANITRSVATWLHLASSVLPDRMDYHAQVTIARSNLQTYMQPVFRRTSDHLNHYQYDVRASDDGTDPNGTALYRYTGGGYARMAGGANSVSLAAGVEYRINASFIGTSQRGWTNDTLGVLSTNDATPGNQLVGGVAFETWGQPGGPATATATVDDLIVCSSSRVTITGLSSDYKLRVGGIVSGASTGSGSVSVDLAGTRLPVAQIEILDATNTVVKTFVPADGVWGGDQYTYTP